MTWTVILLDEVEAWLINLAKNDPETADQVEAAIDLLADQGRHLAGRSSTASRVHNCTI